VANGGTGASTATTNTIFAGPNGSSGAPAFRSLVAADLPSLTSSYIANTTTAQTGNFNISGSGIIGGALRVNGVEIGKGPGDGFTSTVFGDGALIRNSTGNYNIAIGYMSLMYNSTGNNNISIGASSLGSNDSGSSNISIGNSSLSANSTGTDNLSIGNSSLNWNEGGTKNVALGNIALQKNTSGRENVAVGWGSLYNNTIGIQNTAIGYLAGFTMTAITGSNNTLVGSYALPSSNNVSNEITLGNSFVTALRSAATSITSLSDRRDKTDIVPIAEGLDFIKQLKPVTFTWNTRDQAKVGIKSAGFIAQDLLALQKSSPIGKNLDLVSENNPEKLEARYNNLLPVLVKAIQDQQQVIENQKTRLDALEKLVQQLIQANGNGSVVAPASDKK
jgi:hypothetical protein